MEILNNIISILTTENETMSSILTAPVGFIEAWISFLLISTLLKIKYTRDQELLYIAGLFFLSLLVDFLIPSPYNVILTFLGIFTWTKIIFKLNIVESVLCLILPTFLFALIGNIILNPMLKILNITSSKLYATPLYRLFYLCTSYIICVIFIFLIKLLKPKMSLSINLIKNLDEKNKKIITSNLILALITVFIQILITFYYINTYSLIFTLLNFISLFAYFSISLYSLTRTMRLYVTTQNLENAENYNATLSYLYDNVKAFHHDFDNMLFIIGGFIDNNDIDGLKAYYKSLEKDGERVNNLAILNPNLINNAGIYNLLMSKYKKAQNLQVEIKLEFFFDFNRLGMPIYEFSRILGILLDNAIEAATESNEKQVEILFRDSSANRTQIISIKNTYNNKDVDTSKIFNKGNTSKQNHSGMGLWEVNQIIKRNNNIKILTVKDTKYFSQTLEIYY